jgi:hypothetical protein
VEAEDGTVIARKTFSRNQPLGDAMLANVVKRFRRKAPAGWTDDYNTARPHSAIGYALPMPHAAIP